MDDLDFDMDVLYDSDDDFQWYVPPSPRDPYTIEPRIDGFIKYSDKKFRQ